MTDSDRDEAEDDTDGIDDLESSGRPFFEDFF